MALGDAWIGIIGTAVGATLGVAGTLVTQWREANARRDDRAALFAREDRTSAIRAQREDHLRDIDARREMYAECLTVARLVPAAFIAYIASNGDNAERFGDAVGEIEALTPRLDLSAPMSVRRPLKDLGDLAIEMGMWGPAPGHGSGYMLACRYSLAATSLPARRVFRLPGPVEQLRLPSLGQVRDFDVAGPVGAS